MTAKELTVRPDSKLALPASYNEIFDLADKVSNSQLVPQCYRGKPADTAVAMMMAVEQGVNPITALSFIAVVNGRPAWFADAVPGIAKAKGCITGYKEWFEGEEGTDSFKAVCEVYTPDGLSYRNEFSVLDAKTAGLHGRNVHKAYPKRMLQWRARSYAIRDSSPEAFFGPSVEELRGNDSEHRGPDRAKEINVNADAPKREIVTMTTHSDASAGQDESPADQPEPIEPDHIEPPKPKKTVADVVMELADATGMDKVAEIEDWMDGVRSKLKPNHIEVLNKAIREAKSRLGDDERPPSNADKYREMIANGDDLDGIAAQIDQDETINDLESEVLFGLLDQKQAQLLPLE